jgi:hypothetical protein
MEKYDWPFVVFFSRIEDVFLEFGFLQKLIWQNISFFSIIVKSTKIYLCNKEG